MPETATAEPKAKVDKTKPCECGCGGRTKGGKFLPGHDAKHKSALQRKALDGDKAAVKELADRNWPEAKPKASAKDKADAKAAAKTASAAKKVGAGK